MNLHADPRALQQAQDAERQRMRCAYRVSLEEENNHCRARGVIPGVREHESAQRAVVRDEPGVRELESAQQAVAKDEPGVREHKSAQRAVARDEPGVREHESAQQAVARDKPGV